MRNSKATGNNKFLKELNETVLLDLIRTNKLISKADLALITGLSPTATGMIVSKLLEKQYIEEGGIGESSGGRRPILYQLRPMSYFSLGIDIDDDYIRYILMDIQGTIVHNEKDLNEYTTVEQTLSAILHKYNAIVAKFQIAQDRMIGVGISVPALVDSESQRIVFAPNLGWKDIDINSAIDLKVPIHVENEAMSTAICENWLGSCVDERNFICINMKSGIGSSIFANGALLRGCCGSAGEIGHIMVDQNGEKCACGNYGCLETFVSVKKIVHRAQTLARQGILQIENYTDDVNNLTYQDIITAAGDGSEAARLILLEAAGYLAMAISNVINTVNPSKIVLGKELAKMTLVMDHIRDIVNTKALSYPASRATIVTSSIGEDVSCLGAAIIPLKKLFGYQI